MFVNVFSDIFTTQALSLNLDSQNISSSIHCFLFFLLSSDDLSALVVVRLLRTRLPTLSSRPTSVSGVLTIAVDPGLTVCVLVARWRRVVRLTAVHVSYKLQILIKCYLLETIIEVLNRKLLHYLLRANGVLQNNTLIIITWSFVVADQQKRGAPEPTKDGTVFVVEARTFVVAATNLQQCKIA